MKDPRKSAWVNPQFFKAYMKAALATPPKFAHLTPLKLNSIQLIKHGITALRRVPGLNSRVFLGLFLNMVLYLGLVAGCIYFYYRKIHTALAHFMSQHLPEWLASFGVAVHVIVMVILGLVALLLSLRISIRLMHLWYESLVEVIIDHHRKEPEMPFQWQSLFLGFWNTIVSIAKDLLIVLGLLMIGLIPIAGELVILFYSFFMVGDAIIGPYRSVVASRGEVFAWPKHAIPTTLLLGVFQTLLLFVPIIGGIFLPIGVLLQIIGFAWYQEQHHQRMVATVLEPPAS